MTEFNTADRLHRLEKLLLQNGEAKSPEEARRILASYSMQFVVGRELAASPTLQIALLTAVNTARRAVHGEVRIVGDTTPPLLIPFPGCRSIGEAVTALGGRVAMAASTSHALLFGTVDVPDCAIALRTVCSGWRGGVVSADEEALGLDERTTTLAGAIAGAVGVSELFQSLRGVNARAGRRSLGYSAWDPGADWMSEEGRGPELEYLPTKLWVIGLGHLGQSLVWNLGYLPYADPSVLRLVFQDFDRLKPANVSTSPLAFESGLGRMKTRISAEWAEHMDFDVRLVERAFADDFTLNGEEPRLAFCGVDNLKARAAVEAPGFDAVVEAGLGTGEEYHAFQLHTFPGPEKASKRWAVPRGQRDPEWAEGLQRLAEAAALDECGKAELAGLQVASSFVGVVTTALAIGQMLRPLHGAPMHASVNGTLGSSGAPTTVVGEVGMRAPRYGGVGVATSLVETA